MAMDHARLLNLVRIKPSTLHMYPNYPVAEHRGPGVHHGFDNNDDDYDMPMDMDHRAQALRGLARGIILLPDGTGFATGSGLGGFGSRLSNSAELNNRITDLDDKDADLMDTSDEDRDLDEQIHKGGQPGESTPGGSSGEETNERGRREETPAPEKTIEPTTKEHAGGEESNKGD